ncbi:MAG TPA: hypothetical protein VFW83_07660 [Bryobacteraceae bacterium]|nr:hypothetical protein [Bryobacteraceae bacterium]
MCRTGMSRWMPGREWRPQRRNRTGRSRRFHGLLGGFFLGRFPGLGFPGKFERLRRLRGGFRRSRFTGLRHGSRFGFRAPRLRLLFPAGCCAVFPRNVAAHHERHIIVKRAGMRFLFGDA